MITIDNTGSVFNARSANEWLQEAAKRPNPRSLWKQMWYEGEISCLFADTNVGKSILAVQIANEIAQTDRVLYFDFEMSDKQFQIRYTDPDDGTLYPFNDNLIRVEYRQDMMALNDIEAVTQSIVDTALRAKAKIIIIDNISWICNRSEDGDAAGHLMQKLVELKRMHNLSLLVLAHTPKRNISAPINQNSLAGSKKLANFFDSIIAIGHDKNDKKSGRYIKQIKTRTGELLYGETNVIVCKIDKVGSYLSFVEVGHNWERAMLEEPDADDIARGEAREKVLSMIREGKTIRVISKDLRMSPKTIIKYRREAENNASETPAQQTDQTDA